ncbi:hypothetical protein [Burkholderia pseudomallei]|uniref:hypothetical protein n=1 Tax=Burkholderia pseudomallei TaxID=28450 RepID=UPI000A2F4297
MTWRGVADGRAGVRSSARPGDRRGRRVIENGPRGRSVFFAACVSAQRDRCCPTPDARRPTPDARRPTPDARRPTPDARRPTPDARRPTPDARRPTPDAQRTTHNAQRTTLRARHIETSAAGRRAARHAARCGLIDPMSITNRYFTSLVSIRS